MTNHCAILIVNFGGPRHLAEVPEFLEALLTDRDVIRTGLPAFLHNPLFRWIAKKRANKVRHDYASIGGKSPIFADTEAIATKLRERLDHPILTFHRYLPATHASFLASMRTLSASKIVVFPMFPQFTHATTGSIARWMRDHLPKHIWQRMVWIKSYADHPAFIKAYQNRIGDYLQENKIDSKDCFLFFSPHGIPKKFIRCGDPYPKECASSFARVMEEFPHAEGILAFQSKFGPGEWIRPYTIDVCQKIDQLAKRRRHVLFVPISFTSDHIETLFEIEQEYMPVVSEKGYHSHRVPALNRSTQWVEAIEKMLINPTLSKTEELIR